MNESFGLHAGLVPDTHFDAVHQLEGKEWNSRIPNKLGSQAENVYRYKFPTVSDRWVSVCKQPIARILGSFSDRAKRSHTEQIYVTGSITESEGGGGGG